MLRAAEAVSRERHCTALVTGDSDLLSLADRFEIAILTPAQLLPRLRGASGG